MLCGIYGILPQVALWGKGKLCLKGTTQALMTHRSLQTFHENRKKTVVSREDKRVAEMRFISFRYAVRIVPSVTIRSTALVNAVDVIK